MSDENAAATQMSEPMTKEGLFPEGLPGTPERARNFKEEKRAEMAAKYSAPEATAGEGEADTDAPLEDEVDLAQAQETEEQEELDEEAQQYALERMKLGEFLNQAGVPMQEFYNNVFVDVDGTQMSISTAWDEYKTLKDANDSLLRERKELVEKVNQTATHVMQPGVSPEAQLLANQAQMKLQQIKETDWSQVDPGMAANMKFDLQAQANDLWQQAQGKQAEHESNLQTEMRKALEEADRMTRAAIPEWNDQSVRNTEWKSIQDMLVPYGIQPQEIDTVVDPRWRRFFRDSLKARAEKARIKQGARKIRKVGKTMSAGSRVAAAKTPTLDGARAQLQKAREGGATREQMHQARLHVELPDIKPAKRRR